MLRSDDKEWISPRTKYEAFVFVTWKIRRKLFSANPLSEAMPSEAIENKVHSVIVIEHLVPVAGTEGHGRLVGEGDIGSGLDVLEPSDLTGTLHSIQ